MKLKKHNLRIFIKPRIYECLLLIADIISLIFSSLLYKVWVGEGGGHFRVQSQLCNLLIRGKPVNCSGTFIRNNLYKKWIMLFSISA